MLDKIVNWELVDNPFNWITVALMILIFGFAAHILIQPPGNS